MSRLIIEGSYAKLCGMRSSLPSKQHDLIPLSFLTDYRSILGTLRTLETDDFSGFDLPGDAFNKHDNDLYRGNQIPFNMKLNQLIQYLEMIHRASNKIVEIGSIYNLIRDTELKSRCSDLLSAPDHFDRVINQATQILEDRVRKKVPSIGDMTGLPLVGKAINPEPSKSMIVFSTNPSEQEGYANLFKGLMGTFRNPSHHKFLETVTREQALQICAFIDNMLAALEGAEVKSA
jgi:Protein of unknown function (Hypoth_ymh)